MSLFSFYKLKRKRDAVPIQPIQVSPDVEIVNVAELNYAKNELDQDARQRKYSKIDENIKLEVAKFANENGPASALKQFSTKYPDLKLNRTFICRWRKDLISDDPNKIKHIGSAGRSRLISEEIMKQISKALF